MGPILIFKYIEEYFISKTKRESNSHREYKINNIPIYALSFNYFDLLIEKYFDSNSQNLIITLNLDFLRIAEENSNFKDICIKAELVTADGIGVVRLLKIKYGIKIERITGNDILHILLAKSVTRELKYAFIGASEITQNIILKKLQIFYPKVKALLISPPHLFDSNEAENINVVARVREYQPDVLIVALGCPRQEFWLNKYRQQIGAKVNVGVGAALDYFAGTRKRAPAILQNGGLEWLWRLACEPRKLIKRYVLDFIFFLKQISAINVRRGQ